MTIIGSDGNKEVFDVKKAESVIRNALSETGFTDGLEDITERLAIRLMAKLAKTRDFPLNLLKRDVFVESGFTNVAEHLAPEIYNSLPESFAVCKEHGLIYKQTGKKCPKCGGMLKFYTSTLERENIEEKPTTKTQEKKNEKTQKPNKQNNDINETKENAITEKQTVEKQVTKPVKQNTNNVPVNNAKQNINPNPQTSVNVSVTVNDNAQKETKEPLGKMYLIYTNTTPNINAVIDKLDEKKCDYKLLDAALEENINFCVTHKITEAPTLIVEDLNNPAVSQKYVNAMNIVKFLETL